MPFQGTRAPTPDQPDASDWRLRGACRDHDPELFFPDGDEPLARVQAGTAKAICRTCPVAGACLAWALFTRQSYGVWGGLTQDERRAVLAVRAQAAVAPTGSDRIRQGVVA